MSADEAMEHYKRLIANRIARVDAEEALVLYSNAPANVKKRLLTKLRKARTKAMDYATPRQGWQVQAAKRLYQQYGVNAAVGWLRAYGWKHSGDIFREVTGKRMAIESLGDCLMARLAAAMQLDDDRPYI
jgi:hypothetical protein